MATVIDSLKTPQKDGGAYLGGGLLGVPLAGKLGIAGVPGIDQDPNRRARLQGRAR
jgi:hypothetical protein